MIRPPRETFYADVSPTLFRWLMVGVVFLAVIFTLAIAGVVDLDDAEQRSPITLPDPVYATDAPVQP